MSTKISVNLPFKSPIPTNRASEFQRDFIHAVTRSHQAIAAKELYTVRGKLDGCLFFVGVKFFVSGGNDLNGFSRIHSHHFTCIAKLPKASFVPIATVYPVARQK